MKPLRLRPVATLILGLVLASAATAQPTGLPPEVVLLTTKDGVQLKCTYYPANVRKGSPQSKQVAPVVLLPDLKGTRVMFTSLAEQLQAAAAVGQDQPAFAVIAVDLRGHGESTIQLGGGGQVDLDPARLVKNDFLGMVEYDMEGVRRFLVERNDAGEFNLNKLCLVGSGLGASVAANWALKDWSTPPLAVVKQGQDVKALVLISPRWSYSGLSMQMPMKLRPLVQNAAWMLIYGEKEKKVKEDAVRIRKQLARYHPQTDNAGGKQPSGLLEVKLPSTLQGDTLLKQAGAAVEQQIVTFLIENVANSQQPWLSRLDKLP